MKAPFSLYSMIVLICGINLLFSQQLPDPPDNLDWFGVQTVNERGPFSSGPQVAAVGETGSNVYVAGTLPFGAENVLRVAHWDGNDWHFLGSHLVRPGIQTSAGALAVDAQGNVYVGGNFTVAYTSDTDSVESTGLARWNVAQQRWEGIGQGGFGIPTDLGFDAAGNLYVSGLLNGYNSDGTDIPVNGVGRWTYSAAVPQWQGFGLGLDGLASALTMHEDGFYIGGTMLNAFNNNGQTVQVSGIASWSFTLGEWESLAAGLVPLNGFIFVSDMLVDQSGLFVAGDFSGGDNGGGNVAQGQVLFWANPGWVSFDAGVENSMIYSSIEKNGLGEIFLSHSSFQPQAAYLSRWNGTQWDNILQLGQESFPILAANQQNPIVHFYAGGFFDEVVDIPNNQTRSIKTNVWRTNVGLQSMIDVGPNGSNGVVRSWERSGNGFGRKEFIYAGGQFSQVGGTNSNNITRYDGASWSSLSGGTNGTVHTVAAGHSNLVAVGGEFTQVINPGGSVLDAPGIALWDEQNEVWFPVGGGVGGTVYDIANLHTRAGGSDLGVLVVVGDFNSVIDQNGVPTSVRSIAEWDFFTEEWRTIGEVAGGAEAVYAIEESLPYFFIGGDFTSVVNEDGTTINSTNIAELDPMAGTPGNQWRAIGQGTDAPVRTIVKDARYFAEHFLYIGGDFTGVIAADGTLLPAGHVTGWFRERQNSVDGWWVPLSGGVNGTVNTIEVMRFTDYAGIWIGGDFNRIIYDNGNQRAANNVASYAHYAGHNTTRTWNARADGVNGPVYDLLAMPGCWDTIGELVYVGGDFTIAGVRNAFGMAKWKYRWQNSIIVSHSARVSTGGGGGSGTSVKGVAFRSYPNCGAIYQKNTEVTVFDSLSYGESVAVNDIPLFEYFDFKLEPVQNPSAALEFDSLLFDQQNPLIISLTGILDTTNYSPNPDGRTIALSTKPFEIQVNRIVAGQALTMFIHAVTDAPMIQLEENGNILADSLRYGDASGGVNLQPGNHIIDIIRPADGQMLGSFPVDVSQNTGESVVLTVAGFMNPAANENGPPISLHRIDTGINPLTGFSENEPSVTIAKTIQLNQNYPNPFNPETAISFTVPAGHHQSIAVRIFNILGQEIQTLRSAVFPAGEHTLHWDGTDSAGEPVASGVYIYGVITESQNHYRKMSLLK
ncbi:MAG: FlgD immunoglobulin-like domain containing protein [Calditrichia bacterium]